MRYIALILARAIVLAAFAAAATEAVAPSPITLPVFPFELEDFSAATAYIPR